jgi:hypothetical protein
VSAGSQEVAIDSWALGLRHVRVGVQAAKRLLLTDCQRQERAAEEAEALAASSMKAAQEQLELTRAARVEAKVRGHVCHLLF